MKNQSNFDSFSEDESGGNFSSSKIKQKSVEVLSTHIFIIYKQQKTKTISTFDYIFIKFLSWIHRLQSYVMQEEC